MSGFSAKPTRRSMARLCAVMGLYKLAASDGNADASDRVQMLPSEILSLIEGTDAVRLHAVDQVFLRELLDGVGNAPERFDGLFAPYLSPRWPLARLDSVLRTGLRLATYELTERKDIPQRAIISDYLNLLEAFALDKNTRALANAILDKVARDAKDDPDAKSDPDIKDDPDAKDD